MCSSCDGAHHTHHILKNSQHSIFNNHICILSVTNNIYMVVENTYNLGFISVLMIIKFSRSVLWIKTKNAMSWKNISLTYSIILCSAAIALSGEMSTDLLDC